MSSAMQEPVTLPQMLPADINAELLLSYYPQGACKVAFSGLHKRNTYNDVVEMEGLPNHEILLTLSRNSLYNALPEYMFHPIDRFDNIPKSEEKERFEEELERQTEEIANAYRFFAPFDLLLLKLKTQVRERIEAYAKENIIMQQILGDTLTPQQRGNRFIRQMMTYLPECRRIRGNKTLLTFILRKIFLGEGLHIHLQTESRTMQDEHPRYDDSLGLALDEGFVGNTYCEDITTYHIQYWDDDACSKTFDQFLDDMEEFRLFVKDFFLAIKENLHFDIVHKEDPIQLGEENTPHYLNYNINI